MATRAPRALNPAQKSARNPTRSARPGSGARPRTVAMLDAGIKEAEKNFAALVVGTEAADFSVGANLMLVLLEAQEGNWDEIDLMVRTLQRTTQALRYASVPVVVCPAGMSLGGLD